MQPRPVREWIQARRQHAKDLGARCGQDQEREQQRRGHVLAPDVLGGVAIVYDARNARDHDENGHHERSKHDEVKVRDEIERREAAHRHQPQQRQLDRAEQILQRLKRFRECQVEVP